MTRDVDLHMDRLRLKTQLLRWRTLAIILALVSAWMMFGPQEENTGDFASSISSGLSTSGYIARYKINGIIADDVKRSEFLAQLAKNKSVKAVIISLDTPGGTAVGGEQLYLDLRKLAESKPVVATMRTMATSAGYMAALGADHILAQEGTLTGSIGVILQTAEFSQLAEKLGITPVTIKSGPNKSVPSPFEKMDEAQRQTIESVVQDFYRFFAELVAKRRKLPEEQVAQITDGRIFTGRQALESKLIDAIGGEREAVEWLHKNHKIPLQTRIRDAKPRKEVGDVLDQIQQFADETLFSRLLQRLDGLVLIWQPESI